MQKTSTQAPFEKERAQTDESLTVERGKTDESFDSYKKIAESNTDLTVNGNRKEADQARMNRRSKADDRQGGNHSIETQLQKDRNLEDSAIRKERQKNDLALELEREEKEKLLNNLVSLERQTTDENLLSERAKTDLEAQHAATLLTAEKTAHLDTKSALTTREEFVAIVSHDLRNPIGAILSASEMVLEDPFITNMSEDAKRCLELIRRNAKTSLRLISDLLDMERIVDGKIQLQKTPNKLSQLVNEVVESFAQAAVTKKINLKYMLSKEESLIPCDRDRIAQVLSNLVGNALNFTPEKGSVTVATEENPTEIKVSITDTGPGIPEDKKGHIFDRFAQIGNENRTGLGLGLYISKTLIDSHHGKIGVTSAREKGSVFYFTLPKK